jgi:hypothetical protein
VAVAFFPRPQATKSQTNFTHTGGFALSNDSPPIQLHPENELDDGRHRFDIQNPNASEICKAIELARAVDPSKCFTCSKDKLGHGVYIKTRIPSHWAGLINYLVEKIPAYRSASDLFRDGLCQRAAYLAIHEASIDPAELAPFILEVLADRAENALTQFETSTKKVESILKKLIIKRDFEATFLMIDQFRQAAKELPEPYRGRIEKDLALYERRAKKRMKGAE